MPYAAHLADRNVYLLINTWSILYLLCNHIYFPMRIELHMKLLRPWGVTCRDMGIVASPKLLWLLWHLIDPLYFLHTGDDTPAFKQHGVRLPASNV